MGTKSAAALFVPVAMEKGGGLVKESPLAYQFLSVEAALLIYTG